MPLASMRMIAPSCCTGAVASLLLLPASAVFAFAEDVCPGGADGWQTCTRAMCDPHDPNLVCESLAFVTTFASQARAIAGSGGSRSTVHFDATYYLAQAAGFSPLDALVVAQYDQALDTSSFTMRDEDGALPVDPSACETPEAPPECMLHSASVGGLDRNDFAGGGVFYHFMAPPAGAEVDGRAPAIGDPDREPFLNHVRRWAWGQGPLCVGGFTDDTAQDCYRSATRPDNLFVGRIPFVSELGFIGYIDWTGKIEEQRIAEDAVTGEQQPASALDVQFDRATAPLVRLGIYLHALQDRVSHRLCVDASELIGPRPADAGSILLNPIPFTVYELLINIASLSDALEQFSSAAVLADPEFLFVFNRAQCDQPAHASRHAYETGFAQSELPDEQQNTLPALIETLRALEDFAHDYEMPKARSLDEGERRRISERLIQVLEIREPAARVAGFGPLAEAEGWLPLPLHHRLDFESWKQSAGTPAFAAVPQDDAGSGGGAWHGMGLLIALLLRAFLRRPGCWRGIFVLVGLPAAMPAAAWDYELGPISFNAQFKASTGAAWRLQDPDTRFIVKTNIEGQQNLCAPDACISFTGDPEPNQRLVDAEGGYFILNGDDGNLNYDKGDVTYATTRFVPTLTASWGDWQFKTSALAYYDWANVDFDERHPNTIYQSPTSPRPQDYEDEYALGAELREWVLSGYVPVFDDEWLVSIGAQTVRWGEANTLLFNTLNMINPLDARVARMPGAELSEIQAPLPMVLLSGPLFGNWSADLIWMFDWDPVRIDTPGSFMSTSDVAGGGDYAVSGLGQFSEDPNGEFRFPFPASLATDTSATVDVLDEKYGYPDDGNEFGLRLNYFAENLLSGTEFSFYYLRYHSRLPYASVIAAEESCARDSDNALAALADCRGFSGTLDTLIPGEGLEPIPIDTLDIFLDYPEKLQLGGLSVSTNIGKWAVGGELAYHHNLPLQVQIVDVVFAGLQPAFPRQDLLIGVETLEQLLDDYPVVGPVSGELVDLINLLSNDALPTLTIPGSRTAVPDFLSGYRGEDIQPRQTVHGYEQFKVLQLAINGLRSLESRWIGADQLLLLGEVGITHVIGLPELSELQLDGGADNTHASPGADGTGNGGVPNPNSFNPTQQTDRFATATSWGYRLLLRANYSNLIGNIGVNPTVLFQHDVGGTSPFPMQNFVEGRMSVLTQIDFEVTRGLRFQLNYQGYFGGGNRNIQIDRDSAGVAVIAEF